MSRRSHTTRGTPVARRGRNGASLSSTSRTARTPGKGMRQRSADSGAKRSGGAARAGATDMRAYEMCRNLRSHWRSLDESRKDRLQARCSELIHPAVRELPYLSVKLAGICSDLCLSGWETVALCSQLLIADCKSFESAGSLLFELFYQFAQEDMRGV